MTIALLISLGKCIVRIKSLRVKIAQKDFSISRQKRISMPAMRVCVPGAHYTLWRSNKFLWLVVRPRGLQFWTESKINSRCYWRCLLSWQVLFQQRETRISWRICSNSEIRLWLWKVLNLVVCSQSSFTFQEHVKTTKRDQTRFFLAKKDGLGTRQTVVQQYPISVNQIYRERIVCGLQSTRDYWRCVLSTM